MKIGIIGGGMVGRATARCFVEQHDVRVWDVDPSRRTVSIPFDALDCGLVFVCLPTPQSKDGRGCDIKYLLEFFGGLDTQWNDTNFVLKSTVPIGTTRKLKEMFNLPNIVHSPEFLTARCSLIDAQIPARNIVGFPNSDRSDGGGLLHKLYASRFKGVSTMLMSSDESEAVKLITNGFFAQKVAYFNEVNHMCAKLGLDWHMVLSGVMSDGRIANSHIQVPGPDGQYGFGGECLPKDLNNLITCIEESGAMAHVTRAASERNKQDRERK
jgi:nucleotide sugar dehydrogenase